MDDMEIHFYESYLNIPANIPIWYGWRETERAIEKKEPIIVTVQMGLMSTRLIEKGYRIFVHLEDGQQYEISMSENNTCTDKEIRPAHNIFRMWEAGAFHP